MWSKILQPEQKTLDIIKPYALDSESLNYEILRKGGLILLCDSLCENIGNVESTTWLIVNYTQNIVQCINESPVQGKFSMYIISSLYLHIFQKLFSRIFF